MSPPTSLPPDRSAVPPDSSAGAPDNSSDGLLGLGQTALTDVPSKAEEGAASDHLLRWWKFALLYTLFVILFGAVVRITGSGAGCGQHWPTCHGEIAHLPRSLETVIELTHRLTSGLSMVLVFGLTWLTFRRLVPSHPARRQSLWVCGFLLVEALVGAGLVLLELVGNNSSVGRAVIMAVHLLNTFALVFSQVSLLSCLQIGEAPRLRLRLSGSQGFGTIGAFGLLAVSATGAVTALGDTLYPVTPGATAALGEGAHFLEQLRGVHPLLATACAVLLLVGAGRLCEKTRTYDERAHEGQPVPLPLKLARWVTVSVVVQVMLGLLNIGLSAPGWLQVTHLAVANLVWILWTLAWISGTYEDSREGEPLR